MKTEREGELAERAQLFKALGNPTRLLILNLIRIAPRHGEELATLLKLSPATVSHHLAKLSEVGLLQARKEQYTQSYTVRGDLLEHPLRDLVNLAQPTLAPAVEQDAYRKTVVATFFQYGRLARLPTQHKKRRIILETLLEEFEPDHPYAEREVNVMLADFTDDFATVRRLFIEEGLMTREAGVYHRL